ncbi:MAG: hypothetical protein H6564_06490 [Lewinellaceae bacterium]|nr:hypothetical protein [Lewinellaceae bacterium]
MMKIICLFSVIGLLTLGACNGTGPGQGKSYNLPAACDLVPVVNLQDILRESVKNPTPANAGVGEVSACTYTLPAHSLEEYLGIYVLPPRTPRDAAQLQALADEWKERNTGADYELVGDAKYPMAWFPGEHKAYPSTFIILFKEASLVITGVGLEDSKSIAFQAMVAHEWQ